MFDWVLNPPLVKRFYWKKSWTNDSQNFQLKNFMKERLETEIFVILELESNGLLYQNIQFCYVKWLVSTRVEIKLVKHFISIKRKKATI